jgi:hypothetical protein
MLFGISKSDRAIEVNIQIMRAFGHLRPMVAESADLRGTVDALRDHHLIPPGRDKKAAWLQPVA